MRHPESSIDCRGADFAIYGETRRHREEGESKAKSKVKDRGLLAFGLWSWTLVVIATDR
jgi:hypothetical protein